MTADLLTRPWTPRDLEILDAATRREFLTMLGAAGLLAAFGGGGGGDRPAHWRRPVHERVRVLRGQHRAPR